jgi:predicted MFS family arabinose efflux permease
VISLPAEGTFPVRSPPVIATLLLGGAVIGANLVAMAALTPFIMSDVGDKHAVGVETAALLGTFPIVSFMANLGLAPFLDRGNQSRLMFYGAIGCAGSAGLGAISPDVIGIVLSRGTMGIFMPVVAITVFAFVGQNFDRKRQPVLVGYVAAGVNVAGVIMAPLTVVVSTVGSWRLALLSLSAMGCAFAWMCRKYLISRQYNNLPPRLTDSGSVLSVYLASYAGVRRDRPIVTLLCGYFALTASAWIFIGLYPTWLLRIAQQADWRPGAVPLVLLAGGLGSVAGAWASGRLASSKRGLRAAAIGMAAGAIAAALIPLGGNDFIGQAVLNCAVMFSAMGPAPYLRSVAMNLAGQSRTAIVNGLLNSTYQLASAFGVFVGTGFYATDSRFVLNVSPVAMTLAIGTGVLFLSRLYRDAAS